MSRSKTGKAGTFILVSLLILSTSSMSISKVKAETKIFRSVSITIIDRYEGRWRYDISTNVPAKLTFYLYDEHKNLVHVYEEPWYSSSTWGIFGGYIPPGTKGTLRIKAEDEHGNIEWWEGIVDLSYPFTLPLKITTIVDLPPEFKGRMEVDAVCIMPNLKEYQITVSIKNIGDEPVVFSLQYILKTEKGEILFIEKDKPWLEHKEPLLPGEEAGFRSRTGGYWKVPPDSDPTRWTMTVHVHAEIKPAIPPPEDLRNKINRRLEIESSYRYPDYLLDPHHLGMVTAIWLKVSSWGEYTKRTYDQFYWSGVMFDSLSLQSLIKARDFLEKGDIANAEKYLQKYFRYAKLRDDMFAGAADLLDKNLETVQSLLIAEVSEDLAALGLSATVGPEMRIVVDLASNLIWTGAEYSFDTIIMEKKEAVGEALTKAAIHSIIKMTLDDILTTKFDFLDGRTIPEWIQNREGKYLFPMLYKLFESEEWQFKLSKAIKGATVEVGVELTESTIDKLVDLIRKEIEGMLSFQEAELRSPGELRVYDSKGRVTGLLNNKTREEIPRSIYYNGMVMLFNTSDSFVYEVVGTGVGNYGLTVTLANYKNVMTFNATNIPISIKSTHRYVIDRDKLSKGEKGVTVQVDFDGDGVFEHTFTSDSELTHDEFVSQTKAYVPAAVVPAPTLPTSLSIVMGSPCFDASGVDRHLVELYFPSARFEPYPKYEAFYPYIIVGGPFVNPSSAAVAERSGIKFGRDWMDVNGTVYRSEWGHLDYAIVLIKGGAMYVMGTHRYGTEAALLWLSRKPSFYSYAIIKWVDINGDRGVDWEEISEVVRI
jgi:hypothetical protein